MKFLVGLSAIWIILWLFYGLDPVDLWTTATGTHLALNRNYITWLFFHLYDFFVFLGIPLFVAWLASLFISWRGWRQGNVDILAATFVIGLLVLNISGTSRGETARVWAFLLPLVLLISVRYIPREGIVYSGLVILLVLQIFISNIFLRPVGTGLTNPPPSPVEDTQRTDGIVASWIDGPILHDVTFPDSIETGQAIRIGATWSTSEQIEQPYTIFVHLLDDQDQLVAQFDGMPLNGQWPTTCWRSGSKFADHYEIDPPADLPAQSYDLKLGLYWLPSGERLPIQNPTGIDDHSFPVGSMEIVDGTSSAGQDN